jgi:hypothetical protein
MSTGELLARLSRLDAHDRAWLLGELPAAMRRELASLLSDEPRQVLPTPPAATASGWEALDEQRLATLFEAEPAWLVSAATRGTEPRWRDRLLHAMGARRRHEIELADRSGGVIGERAASCLLEGCRERLAAGVEARDSTPRHGFGALLDHMKERFS